MRFFRYRLGETPFKTARDITLLKNERCLTKVFKDTLCLSIFADEKPIGYVFHGTGQFVIDSIVETKRGAVGKPTVKDLKQPFIMIGNITKIEDNLTSADSTDLNRMGYEDIEGFVQTANRLCERFLHRGRTRLPRDMRDTLVFAFAESRGEFDIVVLKGDSLVYKSKEKVFVSKRDKTVLKCPEVVVSSKRGKTVIIASNRFLVEK
jgi:hypothetical protein